jgi:hypothetical protein
MIKIVLPEEKEDVLYVSVKGYEGSNETPFIAETKEEEFFLSLFNQMKTKLSDDYPDSIFYMIDDKVYMKQDKKTKNIWIRYEDFWSVFESKFGYKREETRELLRGMLEKHLKLKEYTPLSTAVSILSTLERHLKLKGYTPEISFINR